MHKFDLRRSHFSERPPVGAVEEDGVGMLVLLAEVYLEGSCFGVGSPRPLLMVQVLLFDGKTFLLFKAVGGRRCLGEENEIILGSLELEEQILFQFLRLVN